MKTKSSESEIIQSNALDSIKNTQPNANPPATPKITEEDRHHLVEKINALCDCV